MQAGSLLWLIRHELRLWWRKISDTPRFRFGWSAIALFLLAACILAWFYLQPFRSVIAQTGLPNSAIWGAVGVWIFFFLSAWVRSIDESVIVLFERGDLDLLLSSPISSRVIFASRLLGLALQLFLGFNILIVPASLLAVLLGLPQLLGIYPAMMAICLTGTSLGMLLTVGLVRWRGARQARTWSQVLTAIVTAIFVIGTQSLNLSRGINLTNSPIWKSLQKWVAPGSWLSGESWLWFPARSILFDPVSVILTLIVSAGFAYLTVEVLHQAFIDGSQQSVTRKGQSPRTIKDQPWSGGLSRAVLNKEWRIIRRNPYLISQVSFQLLLYIPIFIPLLRDPSVIEIAWVITVAMPLLGGQLTYALTFIGLSGEEAPDLLQSAPVLPIRLRRLKMLAALLPVWCIVMPLLVILVIQDKAWLPAFGVTLGATLSSSLLRFWNSRPARLSEIFKWSSIRQADFLLTFVEAISPMLWAALGFTLYGHFSRASLILAIVLVLILSGSYGRSRQLGTFLSFS
jgi:ABC-2 type transport system permease protein